MATRSTDQCYWPWLWKPATFRRKDPTPGKLRDRLVDHQMDFCTSTATMALSLKFRHIMDKVKFLAIRTIRLLHAEVKVELNGQLTFVTNQWLNFNNSLCDVFIFCTFVKKYLQIDQYQSEKVRTVGSEPKDWGTNCWRPSTNCVSGR